ncbi:MAG: cysteine dioxygenase family protein, partial [Rhodospirillaceae bacterium]|nr:cysteine dioxygenase family protein [Rhodospirillaceae bacterium]
PVPDSGYTRHLIFRDPSGRFGLWLFTWAPGAVTPIHDHHCLCLFGIYEGVLEERMFAAEAPPQARLLRTAERQAGYISGDDAAHAATHAAAPPRAAAHQIANLSGLVARSVHLYAFDPDRHADSLRHTYDSPHWTS